MASRKRPALPAYQRIATGLRNAISSGQLTPASRLPSERMLAAQHKVSLMTARRALAELERLGLATRRPGSGTYVGPASGGARRLRDPHEEFAAPNCRFISNDGQWTREWTGPEDVWIIERINLETPATLGTKPLLEVVEDAAFAVEEVSCGGEFLQIDQVLFRADQTVVARRQLHLHRGKLRTWLPR